MEGMLGSHTCFWKLINENQLKSSEGKEEKTDYKLEI